MKSSSLHSRSRIFRSALVVSAVGILASGCVTKGTYNQLVDERDNLATRLSLLEAERNSLEAQLNAMDAEVLILGERLSDQRQALDHAKRTYDQIVEELEEEVSAGQIAVELMRSGVNVRISEEMLFQSGSAEVGESGRGVLGRLGEEHQSIPYQIVVGGHSDSVPIGGELAAIYPTNWDLAGARAAHVVSLLQGSGIPGQQLVALSFGDTRPVASNDSPDGRARNRRIEVRIRPVAVVGEAPGVAAGPPQ
jgi:chemotaxis protein MotB